MVAVSHAEFKMAEQTAKQPVSQQSKPACCLLCSAVASGHRCQRAVAAAAGPHRSQAVAVQRPSARAESVSISISCCKQ